MFPDFPLEELKTYLPKRNEPSDFDVFWTKTLNENKDFPLAAVFTPVEIPFKTIDAFDVSFNGYHGQKIKGWFLLPQNVQEQLPCIVEYIGYGGGRGFPIDWLLWSSLGYAHFIMDTRGQGSYWRSGDTPDIQDLGANPFHPGFMTQGILSPETYYYRRVIGDAVRAVEAARSFEYVDSDNIAVAGGSQGGGLALAVSGLVDDLTAAMPDVPFLCHYRRALEVTNEAPYSEIGHFLKIHRDKVESVYNTLSYFDGLNFAVRANAKALFSVGLADTICPPSTVYAAYNYYQGPKDIRIWEYNNHEGGDSYHTLEQIKFIKNLWP